MSDRDAMISGMDPHLDPEVLVYVALAAAERPGLPQELVDAAFARVEEAEGTTLVLPRDVARAAGLAHSFPCRRITLRVRSDLAGVGLTAAVAGALADAGIPANVVAAFHHDHVLVPADRADRALRALRSLAADA